MKRWEELTPDEKAAYRKREEYEDRARERDCRRSKLIRALILGEQSNSDRGRVSVEDLDDFLRIADDAVVRLENYHDIEMEGGPPRVEYEG